MISPAVLIVGACVAGVGVANELRRCGHQGQVILSDAQDHLPYDRPPLSKGFLSAEPSALAFHDADYYRDQGIELRLGAHAVSLDVSARQVVFEGGHSVVADAIVIATGARARRLPASVAASGIHVVRDMDDAIRLRGDMQPGRSLAMIGGGFIGAEVASTAAKLGLSVTIVDASPMPLSNVLGEAVAQRINALHEAAGVRLRLGTGVASITRLQGDYRVELSDGSTLNADIVVAGLGSAPNVEWLAGSGLLADGGVICDERGQTSSPGVFAAGDVAAWRDTITGKPVRHEHWTAAREQGRIVAQAILGTEGPLWRDFVPYFWSDLHGRRIQLLGSTTESDQVELAFANPATGAFVAEFSRHGRLIGVAGCNAAVRVMRYAERLKLA